MAGLCLAPRLGSRHVEHLIVDAFSPERKLEPPPSQGLRAFLVSSGSGIEITPAQLLVSAYAATSTGEAVPSDECRHARTLTLAWVEQTCADGVLAGERWPTFHRRPPGCEGVGGSLDQRVGV